jgi:membrane-bound lytic murein transglycosylase A
MRTLLILGVLSGFTACVTPTAAPDYGRPLPAGAEALIPLSPGEPSPNVRAQWLARRDILPALDRSIDWTRKPSAKTHFPIAGIDHDRALESLERFREILTTSRSSAEFKQFMDSEFEVYRSAGWDGRGGGVLFTGYCTPIVDGSLVRDSHYRYPLYSLPPDLLKGDHGVILGRRTVNGVTKYPTRASLERRRMLAGQDLELVWLADPIDAYIAHVNGSTVVRLPDGNLFRLGYAGKNGRPYSSLRYALEAAGEIEPGDPGLPALRAWAARTPESKVMSFLQRNESYVFFTPIEGEPHGSLNVPVSAERTLATDKSLFPRGALVFVDTYLPDARGKRKTPFRQLMLDQDTGGAIRTAGRADIYLGVGEEAELRAGTTVAEGQLYYLFLKE